MEIPFTLEYAFGMIPLFLGWIIVFYVLENFRKELVIMGIIAGVGSVYTATLMWTVDWWHPPTITHTSVGFEDFYLGFFWAGIVVGSYETFFGEQKGEIEFVPEKMNWKYFGIILTIFFIVMPGVFFLTEMHSVIAWNIASTLAILYMYFRRPDLIRHGLLSAFVALIAAIIWFWFMSTMNSNFFEDWYFVNNLTGIEFLGGPIEDYIWAVQTGLIFGPIWQFILEPKE